MKPINPQILMVVLGVAIVILVSGCTGPAGNSYSAQDVNLSEIEDSEIRECVKEKIEDMGSAEFKEGEIVLMLSENSTRAEIDSFISKYGLNITEDSYPNHIELSVPADEEFLFCCIAEVNYTVKFAYPVFVGGLSGFEE